MSLHSKPEIQDLLYIFFGNLEPSLLVSEQNNCTEFDDEMTSPSHVSHEKVVLDYQLCMVSNMLYHVSFSY